MIKYLPAPSARGVRLRKMVDTFNVSFGCLFNFIHLITLCTFPYKVFNLEFLDSVVRRKRWRSDVAAICEALVDQRPQERQPQQQEQQLQNIANVPDFCKFLYEHGKPVGH